MLPPPGKSYNESASTIYWVEDANLLCMVSKKAGEISLEERQKEYDLIKATIGDKKACLLIDITNASPVSKESRVYNAIEIPRMFTAIAFLTSSPLGKMLAHLYLGLKPTAIPSKVFTKEKEAREWLQQFY
jgi:hypothetical protein